RLPVGGRGLDPEPALLLKFSPDPGGVGPADDHDPRDLLPRVGDDRRGHRAPAHLGPSGATILTKHSSRSVSPVLSRSSASVPSARIAPPSMIPITSH